MEHLMAPTIRHRSNTISTVLDVIREFPEMDNQEIHHGTTTYAPSIEISEDSLTLDKWSRPIHTSTCRRSSSPEGKDSLKIIKQRRDSYLRSMFTQGSSTVKKADNNNTRGGEAKRTKSRSGSTPTNEVQIDLNTLDDTNRTITQNEEILNMKNSLTMGVDKRVTFYREALLHDAIQRDDLTELCDVLNKHTDVNLDKPNAFGITPLHRAAMDGAYRCMNLLLARNVNVKVRDIYGWTPLHDAVFHGHIRCAAALITAGSNVEAETNDFTKPIEMAHEDEMLLLVGRAMTSPGYVYDPDRETLV
ncbi:ankyrin repeat, PH and SEC7 domain containing protein secG [Exaiptasia diaphana]|uniref:Uncharacterized protein n=1 Tax=Exaiptasia diaphana TaxID=2652724 RepID=A0A913XEX9_EXADI|nr:ankyrin repeat, PH and SEC7 domain containing protein secG [Exaiptasia diaphana]